MKKYLLFIFIVVALLTSLFSFAPGVFASGSCVYNAQHGWHVVGGGQQNDHWYDTQEACLAALVTPTATTPVATETTPVPTEDPTQEPTETPDPTEEVTETPIVTETSTPDPVVVITALVRGNSCNAAWQKILNNKHRDVGYRYFDNPEHSWCQDWLRIKHGIDYDTYKALNP